MALNTQNVTMLIGMTKDLIKKECEKLNEEIQKINSSSDPKLINDVFIDADKSMAELSMRIDQLKKLVKPDPKISN